MHRANQSVHAWAHSTVKRLQSSALIIYVALVFYIVWLFLFNYGWEEVSSDLKWFLNKCNCISLFWSIGWTQRSLFPQSLWKFPQTESQINFLLPNVCIDYYSKLKGCQILNVSSSICTDIIKQLCKMLNTVYFLSGRPALVVVLALKCDRFQTMSSETEGNQHLLRIEAFYNAYSKLIQENSWKKLSNYRPISILKVWVCTN